MRRIDLIVIHCSATREGRYSTKFDLDVCHRRRDLNGPGYHFYIRKDGRIVSVRPVEEIEAHARGHNATSIGICYEGRLDARGRPKDTRTEWQVHLMWALVKTLLKQCPGSRVCGHRDLSPGLNANGEIELEEWIKQCSCFDASDDKKLHWCFKMETEPL